MEGCGKCGIATCRYNSGGQCTDSANREECLKVCRLVLGEQYGDNCQEHRAEKEVIQ